VGTGATTRRRQHGVTREEDEKADRKPDSKGEIHERRPENAESSSRQKKAVWKYPTTLERTRAF